MRNVVRVIKQERIVAAIGSRWFLIGTLSIFVLGALWLAFSLKTGGSYDEEYHLAIISAYKEHFLPFISAQSPSYDTAGDVTRLPSYLYHYLMSWPARGITLFTNDAHTQIFLLRVLNIGFFVSALLVFRRVLDRLGLGRALNNITILILTLLPLSSQLAATVNYDNLLFLLSGVTIYVFIKVITARELTYVNFVTFLSLGMLGSLVKYTFLPLYLPMFLFWIVRVVKHDKGLAWKHIKASIHSLLKDNRLLFVGLGALLLISTVLFVERYGVNVIKYHAIAPKCERLMSTDRCSKYYVWQRNDALLHTQSERPVDPDVFVYFGQWLRGMTVTPFFPYLIVDDSGGPLGALPLPVQTFQFLVVIGFVVLIAGLESLARNRVRFCLLVTSLFYVIVLFADNYSSYLTYHAPVATNGRYLIVVLPILIGLTLFVSNKYIGTKKYLGIVLGSVALLLLMQGGGFMTDVLRGQPSWFQDQGVYSVNESIKRVIAPVIKER